MATILFDWSDLQPVARKNVAKVFKSVAVEYTASSERAVTWS